MIFNKRTLLTFVIPSIAVLFVIQFIFTIQPISAQPSYRLTVEVSSHPWGEDAINVNIKTENGYEDSKRVSTAVGAIATFNIPQHQGDSVQVCVDTGFFSAPTCEAQYVTGDDMYFSLSAR